MENKNHEGNYTGTTNMNAENQDMAFVNDTLENAPSTSTVNLAKDDISEENEEHQLNQK
ncbi:hypothetical protein [Paenibacillus qinlingensis]|uniref:DUF4021 domain-containing protein n=1 Tax=Paenibacillus qinlingensis TaxID=1837343 RepID=A0ABU1NRX3_9BACL|nr:hypothetical protein [Paenibacillus qinlingensis]MDR6549801.1 hypothetical protein [Paenibacillus qinlingensis]